MRASLLLLGLLAAAPVFAQADYGARAGVTLATVSGDFRLADAYETRMGFAAGGVVRLPLRGPVAIQAEVLYLQAGGHIDGEKALALGDSLGVDRSVELTYFELPLLLVLDEVGVAGIGLRLHAGPSVGFEFGEVVRLEGGFQNEETDRFASPTFSLAVGGDVEFGLGGQRAFVGGRYTHGLTDLSGGTGTNAEGNPATAHGRVVLLSAGVFF